MKNLIGLGLLFVLALGLSNQPSPSPALSSRAAPLGTPGGSDPPVAKQCTGESFCRLPGGGSTGACPDLAPPCVSPCIGGGGKNCSKKGVGEYCEGGGTVCDEKTPGTIIDCGQEQTNATCGEFMNYCFCIGGTPTGTDCPDVVDSCD